MESRFENAANCLNELDFLLHVLLVLAHRLVDPGSSAAERELTQERIDIVLDLLNEVPQRYQH